MVFLSKKCEINHHIRTKAKTVLLCIFVINTFFNGFCVRGAVPLAAGRRYAGVWPEPMNIPVLIDAAVPPQYAANIDTAITNINRQMSGGNCVRLTKITTRPTATMQPSPPAAGVAPSTTSAVKLAKPYMYFTSSKVHFDRENPGNLPGGAPATPVFPPFAPPAVSVCDAFVGVDLRPQPTAGEQVVTILWDAAGAGTPCLRSGLDNNNVRVIMGLIMKSFGLFPEILRNDRLSRVEVLQTTNAAILELYGGTDAATKGEGFDMGPFDCSSITMPDPLLYSVDGNTPWWLRRSGECASTPAAIGAVTQISQRDCIAIGLLMFRRSAGCGTTFDELVARCQSNMASTP